MAVDATILGRTCRATDLADAQRFDRRLVEADHRAQGSGDEVQFVLDHEVRRRQWLGEARAPGRVRGSIEAGRVIPVGTSEQSARRPSPRKRGELVDCGNEERRKPPVDRLIDRHDGQGAVPREVAFGVQADDAQSLRRIVIRQQRERVGPELGAAPRAILERDRRRLSSRVVLELADLGARRVRPVVALAPHHVRRRRLADPQPNLERPVTVSGGRRPALQLESTDESRGAAQLVKGEEPQRVAHDDAHASATEPVVARVAEPAQDHREGRKPQVRLRLAAAGREEQQVHCLALNIGWVGQARQVEQDERELERTPARRLDIEPLAQRPGHRAVRDAKCVEGIRIVRQHRDPAVDPSRRDIGEAQQFRGSLASRAGERHGTRP